MKIVKKKILTALALLMVVNLWVSSPSAYSPRGDLYKRFCDKDRDECQ